MVANSFGSDRPLPFVLEAINPVYFDDYAGIDITTTTIGRSKHVQLGAC